MHSREVIGFMTEGDDDSYKMFTLDHLISACAAKA